MADIGIIEEEVVDLNILIKTILFIGAAVDSSARTSLGIHADLRELYEVLDPQLAYIYSKGLKAITAPFDEIMEGE